MLDYVCVCKDSEDIENTHLRVEASIIQNFNSAHDAYNELKW